MKSKSKTQFKKGLDCGYQIAKENQEIKNNEHVFELIKTNDDSISYLEMTFCIGISIIMTAILFNDWKTAGLLGVFLAFMTIPYAITIRRTGAIIKNMEG